jgi:hypothetical protein
MAHDAAWSPDKRLVAFAAGDGLFLLDSNNEKRKIFTASGVVLWPRWSPDGKRLRFTVEDSATASSALWEVRADGLGHTFSYRDGTNLPWSAVGSGAETGVTMYFRLGPSRIPTSGPWQKVSLVCHGQFSLPQDRLVSHRPRLRSMASGFMPSARRTDTKRFDSILYLARSLRLLPCPPSNRLTTPGMASG